MTPMKILVPLDDSPFSRHILPALCRLFPPAQATLVLLRVVHPQELEAEPQLPFAAANSADGPGLTFPLYASLLAGQPVAPVGDDEQASERARHQLEGELRDVGRCLHGYTVSVAVRFGEPATEIVRFVDEEPVDMVAMATHARAAIPQLVLGSVAREVLRNVAVPVLVLRPTSQDVPRGASMPETSAASG